MDKILTVALALAVCFGTTAFLRSENRSAHAEANSNQATDGAFRDGLFVGRLAAAEGKPSHPLIGRWSTQKDRASFLAGYRAGYENRSSQL